MSRSLITVTLVGLFLLQFGIVAHYYTTVYPKLYATDWWQYGYEQLFDQINRLSNSSEYHGIPIFVTRERGRPAMYDWFYAKTDPGLIQSAEVGVSKDQSEYLEFDNRKYIRGLGEVNQLPAIAVSSPEEWNIYQVMTEKSTQMLGEVIGLDGKVIWYINLIQN